MSQVRKGCGIKENPEGKKILRMCGQPGMRFYVLAEAVRQEMSNVRQLHGGKRKQTGLQRGNLRICGSEAERRAGKIKLKRKRQNVSERWQKRSVFVFFRRENYSQISNSFTESVSCCYCIFRKAKENDKIVKNILQ